MSRTVKTDVKKGGNKGTNPQHNELLKYVRITYEIWTGKPEPYKTPEDIVNSVSTQQNKKDIGYLRYLR